MSRMTMLREGSSRLATGVSRMLTVQVSIVHKLDLVDMTKNAKIKTLLTLCLIPSRRSVDLTREIPHLRTRRRTILQLIMRKAKRLSKMLLIYTRWHSCGFEPQNPDNL